MTSKLKKESVVLFNGQSQYDVLRYFIFDLSRSFEKLGLEVTIIDLLGPSWVDKLEQTIKEKNISFFLSMNGMGINLKIGNKSLFDHLNIPYFLFMVDHPMYHLNRLLNNNINNIIISCVDRNHIKFLNKYISGDYTKTFIPHGATTIESFSLEQKKIKDRDIDLLFTGTYKDPDSLREHWVTQPKYIFKLYDEIMERAIYEPNKSLFEVAEEVCENKGIDHVYLHRPLFWQLLLYVDEYIRHKIRKEFINFLSKQPLSIEVYGNGWEKLNREYENIKFGRPLNFSEVLIKMNNSKIVGHVCPSFIDGGHERMFTAMLHGAVSFVDTNRYIESNFEEGKDILTYSLNNYNNNLLDLLDRTNELQKIANRGNELVRSSHMWLNRAKKILETVQYHKFFMS